MAPGTRTKPVAWFHAGGVRFFQNLYWLQPSAASKALYLTGTQTKFST